MSIDTFLLKHSRVNLLCIVYGHFHAMIVELSSCDRDHTTCQPKILPYGPLQKRLAEPAFTGLRVLCNAVG